jgi:hypothetical protein
MAFPDAPSDNFLSSLASRNAHRAAAAAPVVWPRLRQRFEPSPASNLGGGQSAADWDTAAFTSFQAFDDPGAADGDRAAYLSARARRGDEGSGVPSWGTRPPAALGEQPASGLQPATQPPAGRQVKPFETVSPTPPLQQSFTGDNPEAAAPPTPSGAEARTGAGLFPPRPDPWTVQPQVIRVAEQVQHSQAQDALQAARDGTGQAAPHPMQRSPALAGGVPDSPAPPAIQVTIGRVEVRLSPPPVAASARPPSTASGARDAQGLEEYLRRGASGREPGAR